MMREYELGRKSGISLSVFSVGIKNFRSRDNSSQGLNRIASNYILYAAWDIEVQTKEHTQLVGVVLT
jgi:hypothetical protein